MLFYPIKWNEIIGGETSKSLSKNVSLLIAAGGDEM